MKATVKFTDNITPVIKNMKKDIEDLPKKALKVFIENTPVNKGNARQKTKLKGKKQIAADYPYAKKLDEGFSKQNPEGMTKPTEEYIVEEFYKIMKGK